MKSLFRFLKLTVVLGLVAASIGAWWFHGWWQELNRHARPNEYAQRGHFGPVREWPLIPIHLVLLPDGRVMSYGTDGLGNQTGQFMYSVWDPSRQGQPGEHLVLPNTVSTDIFCAGQIVVPANGQVLLVSGDVTKKGVRNYSTRDINWFDPTANALRPDANKLNQLRWYPTLVTLGNGDIFIGGGRSSPDTYTDVPEVYRVGKGWAVLPGATNRSAFGEPNWTYPQMWLAPNDKVFVISTNGETFYADALDQGHIERTAIKLPWADFYLPAVMYEPGKIMAMRKRGKLALIDLNGKVPATKLGATYRFGRADANTTLMADGRVLLNGGSFIHKRDVLPHYGAEIWDPKTDSWTPGDAAERMRLYHSTSLLLPDATVLTSGGGAGGDITPQSNLNMEIYYPPYLYKKDGSGKLVTQRPQILEAPATFTRGQKQLIKVAAGSKVSRVTFVRTGSVTHTNNNEQRFQTLNFKASEDGQVELEEVGSATRTPPGYYLLFVFDEHEVPSVAKIIKVL